MLILTELAGCMTVNAWRLRPPFLSTGRRKFLVRVQAEAQAVLNVFIF